MSEMIAADYMIDEEQNEMPEPHNRFTEHPACYSLTIFTQSWPEVRQFYKDVLKAEIMSERYNRYSEMSLGGLPICLRACEFGEMVSYFHMYLSLKNRELVLDELRKRGIIVTYEGPYANFRDPEGRVFKLSKSEAVLG